MPQPNESAPASVVVVSLHELHEMIERSILPLMEEVIALRAEVAQATPPQQPLMTPKEVAQLYNVTEATIRRYADDGLLTKIPIGKGARFRFDRNEVEEFFLSKKAGVL
jgi:excisionase family DNA binding protein